MAGSLGCQFVKLRTHLRKASLSTSEATHSFLHSSVSQTPRRTRSCPRNPRRHPATGLNMPTQQDATKRQCSLLLFLATPAEEEALKQAASGRHLAFEK